jgi:hypothetical protein
MGHFLYERQLGGGSSQSSLMAAQESAKRKGVIVKWGLKKAWSKAAARWRRAMAM